MTAAKISLKKAALSNVFVSFRFALQEANDDLETWNGFPTTENYPERLKKIHRRNHLETVMKNLESMVASRQSRNRKGEGASGTRMILALCPECLYKIRASAMWLEIGIPNCPNEVCGRFGMPFQIEREPILPVETTVEETMRDYIAPKVEPQTPAWDEFFEKAGKL